MASRDARRSPNFLLPWPFLKPQGVNMGNEYRVDVFPNQHTRRHGLAPSSREEARKSPTYDVLLAPMALLSGITLLTVLQGNSRGSANRLHRDANYFVGEVKCLVGQCGEQAWWPALARTWWRMASISGNGITATSRTWRIKAGSAIRMEHGLRPRDQAFRRCFPYVVVQRQCHSSPSR
jgi:hypothetical protein